MGEQSRLNFCHFGELPENNCGTFNETGAGNSAANWWHSRCLVAAVSDVTK
jgi:hypothetical protein